MIQTVTFDLWNTIFANEYYSNSRLNYFIQFLAKNQISFSPNELKDSFNSAFQLSDINLEEIDCRHIYTRDRILDILNSLKINLSKLQIKRIENSFEKIMLKNPPHLKIGVNETLRELSEDYNIGLISNTGITPGHIIKKIFKRYDIEKYFQQTLFSDETGFYKPSPVMFNTILRHFNCKPQNAIHIGDILETDIKGAKNCNMLTIWINDSDSPKSKEIHPDYEIQQIYEAVEIIKRIV
ncbi:MAG: HAD family hydrolase [Promethearchaeota archaeon]